MSAIITSSLDKQVKVTSGSIGRTISIGSDWKRLRVAIRWNMDDSGGDIVNYPRMAFGLCSGTSSLFTLDGSNANHFIGLCSGDTTSSIGIPNSFKRETYAGVTYYKNIWGIAASMEVWQVQTSSAIITAAGWESNNTNIPSPQVSCTDSVRTGFLIEFVKSSSASHTTWSINAGGTSYLNSLQDLISTSSLSTWCTQQAPVFTPAGHTSIGALRLPQGSYPMTSPILTWTIDEGTYGPLDTVCFYWNKPTPAVNISDVMVAKLE